jgi:hypothetical protein
MSNKDTRTDHDIIIQSEVNGKVTSETEEMMFNVDVATALGYMSSGVITNNFSGRTLAGEKLTYRWNYYDSLNMYVGKKELTKHTKGVILAELFNNYFTITDVKDLKHNWYVYYGVLFKGTGKPIDCKMLLRGNKVIGIYKPKAKVKPTIKFYEKKIYRNMERNMYVSHTPVDFRPNAEHEVYDKQSPEFTREDELEEIRAFMASLKRRLSAEEQDIINDIASEMDRLRTI